MATVLDGRALGRSVLATLAAPIAAVRERRGAPPSLAVILVGDNPASEVYVRNKTRRAAEIGVDLDVHRFPADASTDELLVMIGKLNDNALVDGILVQTPLPGHIAVDAVMHAIDPGKDADGFHPWNLGMLAAGSTPIVAPCTPKGCMELIRHAGVNVDGANAVVIGRSTIVGRPMGLMLLNANATVTMCHSHTKHLAEIASRADILVVAIGRPHFVQPDWVKEGACIIDVGMNRLSGGELAGDVDPACATRASAYTPVPGGVGPMTVAMLLANTVALAAGHVGLESA